MWKTRRKWGRAAVFILIGGLFPAYLAEPAATGATSSGMGRENLTCPRSGPAADGTFGSCVAGLGCCGGYPEAPCGHIAM